MWFSRKLAINTCAFCNAVNKLIRFPLSQIYTTSERLRSDIFTPRSIFQQANTRTLNGRETTKNWQKQMTLQLNSWQKLMTRTFLSLYKTIHIGFGWKTTCTKNQTFSDFWELTKSHMTTYFKIHWKRVIRTFLMSEQIIFRCFGCKITPGVPNAHQLHTQ